MTASQPTSDLPSHPYYPLDLHLPTFVPNSTPLTRLLPLFGLVVGCVVGTAWSLASRSRFAPRRIDRFAAAWFALCGFLHVVFEGYYLYYRKQLPGMNTTFSQLWKEYALSDSRYLAGDVFTISVETITALAWGPLSLLTTYCILAGRRSTRHVAQMVVCVAHLYGVALYYLTNWVEGRMGGVVYSRPEALYYWVYYVGFNAPWVVVPAVLLWDSWAQVDAAFLEAERRMKQE